MKKLLLLIILIVVVTGAFWAWSAGRPASSSTETALFAVAEGDGPSNVAERLKEAELIRSPKWFLFLVWRRDTKNDFRTGSFELSPSMLPGEIERTLTRGKPLTNERQITVIEGWTLDDIAAYFEKEGVMSKKDFQAEAGESAKVYGANALPDWSEFPSLSGRPKTASLEGYLFPDTYRIYVDAEPEAVVRRMLANFEAKLTPDLRADIQKRGLTIFEVVVMASILEREVRGDEDMAMVSDLFWRRADAGQGLDADSTVNYCTGKSLASVTFEDLKTDCPWNTYKYRGLPIGPIGNPGLAAIVAAVRPKPNDYWYFLTDEEGTVYYGTTLAEHNANKAKYLK